MVPGPSAPTPSRRFDPSEHRRYLDLPGGPEWYNGRDKIYQLQSRDQDTGIIKVETDTAVIKISAYVTRELTLSFHHKSDF
ncbi:hypothetical protein RRF57_001056 [Xylaria bambusicola]|uniref:Uncharacterized protein n=1 Tax=Xylaria bambusicola TaxID=326684 RepID=A0AAN7YUN8_9PEZI